MALPCQLAWADAADDAEKLYGQLFFAKALKVCDEELDGGGLDREHLLRLLKVQGLIRAGQGKSAEAMASFKQLLLLAPDTRLDGPEYAPRIRNTFSRALAWAGKQQLSAKLHVAKEVDRLGRLKIAVSMPDNPIGLVNRGRLFLRTQPNDAFESMVAPLPLKWDLELSTISGTKTSKRIEYYVMLVDRRGNELLSLGSATAPNSIKLLDLAVRPQTVSTPATQATTSPPGVGTQTPSIPEPRVVPVYKKWWLWTVVGVVVVGAGVGLGLGLGLQDGVSGKVYLK